MQKKLQVFVSSTFTDLIVERQAAVSAILSLGHIPAGMELFTANDVSQWETIKRWIDESDIYMLILGGRYGSVEEGSGVSYTEKEFNYAVATKKPLFSIVIRDEALEEKIKKFGTSVSEKNHQKELTEFRKKVLSNMSMFYEDNKDIQLRIMSSLPKIADERTLSGWVSGRDVVNVKSLVDEIGALKNENDELKRAIENNAKSQNNDKQDIKLQEIKNSLQNLKFDDNKFKELKEKLIPEDNLLEVFNNILDNLLIGISSDRILTSRDIFLIETACPKLNLYGLVDQTIKTRKEYDRTFDVHTYHLNALGKSFAIYNQKVS